MLWDKITIETTNEAADIVASVLFDNGIVGAEIDDSAPLSEDELRKMFVDIPIKKVNDGKARVSFYVSDTSNSDYDMNAIMDELNSYKDFMDMGTLSVEKSTVDDKDIFTKWRENFKRIEFDSVHIIPSWEKLNDHDKDTLNIFIEPGSAFGTGQHATTKLCVKSIKELIDSKLIDLNDSSILDVGCGSGILAIAGIKLGIKTEMAIDIDKSVEPNLKENIALNGLKDFRYDFGNLIVDKVFNDKIKREKYTIVVANILAPVIIDLLKTAKIVDFISEGGYFICSGILKEAKEEVLSAIEETGKLKVIDTKNDGDWVCITCEKAG